MGLVGHDHAQHPNGRWLYLICELSCTLVALDFDPKTGRMAEITTLSTLPAAWAGTFSPETGDSLGCTTADVPPLLRVWVEIMGSQKCRIVGKSQPVLIMINPIIFTRTRTPSCSDCRVSACLSHHAVLP
jgi:hypothetical protein